MAQTVPLPTTLEVDSALGCFRHYNNLVRSNEPLPHRESLRMAILDLLFSRHPGRVRLAALREDLPVFFHYWIMWSFLVGCRHAKAGLAENPRIRPRHGYRLAYSSTEHDSSGGENMRLLYLVFPLARNFKALNRTAKTHLLYSSYALSVIARLPGLTESEYRQVALMGVTSGADAILAGNPDAPVSLLSWEFKHEGTYWPRGVLAANPSTPIEDVMWARLQWPSATWVPTVDEVLSEKRWDEFQSWLVKNGYEELCGVPAQWACSVLN